MLTGMYPPSSGEATVGGHNIIHDMTGKTFRFNGWIVRYLFFLFKKLLNLRNDSHYVVWRDVYSEASVQ